MEEDYIIERVEKQSSDHQGQYAYHRSSFQSGRLTFGAKLKIAAVIVGGVAVGTVLFLFFITAFFYLFVPVIAVILIWRLFSRKS